MNQVNRVTNRPTSPPKKPAVQARPPQDVPQVSSARQAWRRMARNRGAMAGLVIIIVLVVTAAFAPGLAPHDPFRQDLGQMAKGSSPDHLLGTDELGRDVLSRIIYGSRLSLLVSVISVGIGLLVGVPLGLVSGFFGGKLDLMLQRLVDMMLAFPGILLAIIVTGVLGVGLANAMIAIGIVFVPTYARLVRSSVLAVKQKEYVEAARALGATNFTIVSRHVLPNCLSPLIVQSTLNVGSAILWAAGLGFLGLGAQAPQAEWGAMLSNGRMYLRAAPHVVTSPGLAIMLTVLGFNLVGDGLRDALDPKMKR